MRGALRVASFVLALLFALVIGLVFALRRTLPAASEQRRVAGLEAEATIAWDLDGVPTLRAANRRDLAFLEGWVHARDRRFQMELYRRNATGRLAELVGAVALPLDRRFRTFGFTAVADSALAQLPSGTRALFEAYAAGVNAWDRSHPAPPEFLALGVPHEPWRARDGLLVLLLMSEQLNDTGDTEAEIERMDVSLPRSLVAFLLPEGTPWDAPLDRSPAPAPPPLPRADEINLRDSLNTALQRVVPSRLAALPPVEEDRETGSNNWAVAPARTRHGGAILAGDPHLALSVPVIWYRERLECDTLAFTGVTIPGLCGVVIGANRSVAWSYTNVEGDLADLVRCIPDPRDSTRYLVAGGSAPFQQRIEVLRVKNAPPETLRVRGTRWGPVIAKSARGGWLALEWSALDPSQCRFDPFRLATARSVRDLFSRLPEVHAAPQNVAAADAEGHIGWRIAGWFPRRAGYDPRRPRDATLASAGWTGWIGPDSLASVIDPAEGFVATANQRTAGGRTRAIVGTGFAMPWRAHRLRDRLGARRDWDSALSGGLQNDVDDAFLGITAKALDRALTPDACAHDDTLASVRRMLGSWTHRADTTSASHYFLRLARAELNRAVTAPLIAPCVAADSTFAYDWPLADEVTRRLLDERPMNLLDPRYEDWDALVRDVARRAVRAEARRLPGVPLERAVWGMVNRSHLHHPFGDVAPGLGRWLNLPDAALAGGSNTVRVANPRSGASLRMVVEFGDSARATFVLPGGESGNFLSPHYGDEFADWVAGRARNLDPGATVSLTTLTSARR